MSSRNSSSFIIFLYVCYHRHRVAPPESHLLDLADGRLSLSLGWSFPVQRNDHSLGFALTKPPSKLKVIFFPLYISSHYSFHPGRWNFKEFYQ